MSDDGSDLAADLKVLADALLTRLGPALKQASEAGRQSATPPSGTAEWQSCSWCPVCALAAVIRGEQHDLVTLLTVEGAALLGIIRDFLASHGGPVHHSSGEPHSEDPQQNAATHFDATASGEPSTESAMGDADLDPVSETGRQPTSRPQFVPITVTTEQLPTEDRFTT